MYLPLAFLGVVLIWSTTPLAIQWSSIGGGFLFGVAARMILGVLVCLALLGLSGRRLTGRPAALATYLAAGLGVWGAMTCVYWASQSVPSGLVAVVFGLTPVVTAVMATVWLKERALTPARLIGIALSLVGLWVIFGHGIALGQHLVLGLGGVLGAVVIHSASAVWLKRINAQVPPLETTTGALLVAVPLFVLNWIIFDGQVPESLPPRTLWSIVYLAVFGSAIGFILYFDLLRQVEASRVALITLMTPVLSLLLGRALNDETLAPGTIVGTAIILVGLALFHWGDVLGRRSRAAVRARAARTTGRYRDGDGPKT